MDNRDGANGPNGHLEDGSPSHIRSDVAMNGSEPSDGYYDHYGGAGLQVPPSFVGRYLSLLYIGGEDVPQMTEDKYGWTEHSANGAIRWDRSEDRQLRFDRHVELVPTRVCFYHADSIYVNGDIRRFPFLTPQLLWWLEIVYDTRFHRANAQERALLRDTEWSPRLWRAMDLLYMRKHVRNEIKRRVSALGDVYVSRAFRRCYRRINRKVWTLRVLLSGSEDGRYLRLVDDRACNPVIRGLRHDIAEFRHLLATFTPDASFIRVEDLAAAAAILDVVGD